MKINLNVKKLDALKPTKKRVDYFDTNLPCFFVRVTPAGVKSFGALYWHAGRKRRYTIGNYPPLTLADAREEAEEILRKAKKGKDPAAEKKQERKAETFKELAELYLKTYAIGPNPEKPKKKSWKEDERRINSRLIPKFGNIRAKAITRGDVRFFLDDLASNAPIEANRTLALLRKIFNWALGKDLVESSPCLAIPRPSQETERERVLTNEEMLAVWNACETDGSDAGKILQLRLITGQRGKELCRMKWADIEDRWWTQHTGETKNRVAHRVWFSDPAWKILSKLPREWEWVFPSPTVEGEPIVWVMKALTRIRKDAAELLKTKKHDKAETLDFQARDLRRTLATRMAESGVDPRTIDRILNHKEAGIIRVYNRYQFDKEKQEAWTLWAKKLTIILSGLKAVDSHRKPVAGKKR